MKAEKEISIAAPAELVWDVLTNINEWPLWQKGVRSSRLSENLALGSTFHWKAGGIALTSTITELVLHQQIGWHGKAIGTDATHLWRLERQNGATRVITNERMSGWLPSLIKVVKPDFLGNALQSVLAELKVAVESQV